MSEPDAGETNPFLIHPEPDNNVAASTQPQPPQLTHDGLAEAVDVPLMTNKSVIKPLGDEGQLSSDSYIPPAHVGSWGQTVRAASEYSHTSASQTGLPDQIPVSGQAAPTVSDYQFGYPAGASQPTVPTQTTAIGNPAVQGQPGMLSLPGRPAPTTAAGPTVPLPNEYKYSPSTVGQSHQVPYQRFYQPTQQPLVEAPIQGSSSQPPAQSSLPKRYSPKKKISKTLLISLVSILIVSMSGLAALFWATSGFGLWGWNARGPFSTGVHQKWSAQLKIPEEERISAAARFIPFTVTTNDYQELTTIVPIRGGAIRFEATLTDGQTTGDNTVVDCDSLSACMPEDADMALSVRGSIAPKPRQNDSDSPQKTDDVTALPKQIHRIVWSGHSGVTVGAATIDATVNGLVTSLLAYSEKDKAVIWEEKLSGPSRVLLVPEGILVTTPHENGDVTMRLYEDTQGDPQGVIKATVPSVEEAIRSIDFGNARWSFLGNQSVQLLDGTGFFTVVINNSTNDTRTVDFASVTPADGTQLSVDNTHGKIDFVDSKSLYADIDDDGYTDALAFIEVKQPFNVGNITLAGQPNTKESTSEFAYVWQWSPQLGTPEMLPDPVYHFISNDTYLSDPSKAGAEATKVSADSSSFLIERTGEKAQEAGFPDLQTIVIDQGELYDATNRMWGGSCMSSDIGATKDDTYPVATSRIFAQPSGGKLVEPPLQTIKNQSAVFITDLPDTSLRERSGRSLVGVGDTTMSSRCYWREN
ncbi:MAG: hypothetical protein Q4P66_08880 [Actinomycetaceae bacterium]|nr:hypothetical protein [Actinomycetaceae bacterium]